MGRRDLDRIGAACGLVGVAGNVIGVVVLGSIPSAYRPGGLAAWAQEVMAAPDAATVSAVSFTLGLVALCGWAVMLGARLDSAAARAGAGLMAIGAILDAAGTPAPLVVARYLAPTCATAACTPASVALLGSSLALDAVFNLSLGVGLVLVAPALWQRATTSRWVAGLAGAAGLASLPVCLQVFSDAAAQLLAIAGPLWLAAIVATSVLLWKGRL